jgi:hypothetical protein
MPLGSFPSGDCGNDCYNAIVCEGVTTRLSCGPIKTFSMNILSAYYGRKSASPCGHPQVSDCKKTVDITSQLKEACNGRHECEVEPTNEWGDPCPNVYKYAEVRVNNKFNQKHLF